ncbi:SUN domain-containing protein 4-like [Dioscorea cayenensis subsp. rotundata]|uniref:SUN domain-containing protein 4-like n=1 Tax=Dioscorea cayennensis subsp. rotundata TaxID=55577 RepID=A0AB40B5L3_DIOCR|nr:SUN domain-containing protein 4-like [Dioscorea cayenensis subsp. rotundata]
MQRSRKALLQRRAVSEKNSISGRARLYKVSLSLVLLLWGIIFLLNSLISHGNGYKDGLVSVSDESICHETDPGSSEEVHEHGVRLAPSHASDENVHQNSISGSESVKHLTDISAKEDNQLSTNGEKQAEENSELNHKAEDGTFSLNNKVEPLAKNERVPRVAPLGLDEFKSRAITPKGKPQSSKDAVVHRVEPGGKEYNYASANKGAKVLAFNKEAKGASNILDKDKDKYLRNPCSAEEKFVVIELSEETLVDSIEMANFEHYSSNLKDFELLGSLVYPTDNWTEIGNFTAGNVKHAQRFSLQEPNWARYLKLNLLSHYGAEFYCTLSVVEVYGVDAVERMLEDLISAQKNHLEPEEHNKEQTAVQEPSDGGVDLDQERESAIDSEAQGDSVKLKQEARRNNVPDPTLESKPPQVGRMPADTVLKILMQKVQSLDVNFSVLERYLDELNGRYGRIFKDFDDDIANKDKLLEKIILDIKNLESQRDVFASDIGELLSWKTKASSQLEQLIKDNSILRSEFKKLHDHHVDVENKILAVIFMSFVFGCLAAAKLFMGLLLRIYRIHNSDKFCQNNSAWLVLLLSSVIIAIILAL